MLAIDILLYTITFHVSNENRRNPATMEESTTLRIVPKKVECYADAVNMIKSAS